MNIELKSKFNLRLTCQAHGWINLAPFLWIEDEKALRWSTRMGRDICAVNVVQRNPQALEVTFQGAASELEVERCVQRVLMLDWDNQKATTVAERCDHRVASILRAGGGRLLRGSTAFEDIVKTICTINTSWPNTKSMVHGLVNFAGAGVFPTPFDVMAAGEEVLRHKASVGYRARTIIAVAELALDQNCDAIELDQLREVWGLGPYAVDHIAILRGDYSRIPFDSEVRAYCAKHLGIIDPNARKIEERFADWGRYRFLGYKFGRIARQLNWLGE